MNMLHVDSNLICHDDLSCQWLMLLMLYLFEDFTQRFHVTMLVTITINSHEMGIKFISSI